ncbi:MAG: COG4315 family predicted lipoprotein [Solirubrobacterales bacterium]
MARVVGLLVAGISGLALLAAPAAAGPGEAPSASAASAQAPQAQPSKQPFHKKAKRAKLTVIDSRYGEMLADRSGRALYRFDKERSDRPRCHGGCATAWPPLKTKKKPRLGKGLDRDLLGTTKRRNGSKQVTYDGKPLYFYIDDRKPGRVGCHDVRSFGGLWLVVSPNGEAVL